MAHVPGTDGSLVLILLMHHPVVYIYLIPGAQGVKRAMGLAILWHGEEQAGCEQINVPGDVKITSSSLPPSLIVISRSPCSPDPALSLRQLKSSRCPHTAYHDSSHASTTRMLNREYDSPLSTTPPPSSTTAQAHKQTRHLSQPTPSTLTNHFTHHHTHHSCYSPSSRQSDVSCLLDPAHPPSSPASSTRSTTRTPKATYINFVRDLISNQLGLYKAILPFQRAGETWLCVLDECLKLVVDNLAAESSRKQCLPLS
jgi:hypothetical protein